MNLKTDSFLRLLCYDSEDENNDDANSKEDWSASEHDYASNSDEDSVCDVEYPCYNPSIDWKLFKSIEGMKFETSDQLKESLIDYGVANGYQLRFIVNDHKRLLVRCGKEETIEDEDADGKKTKKKIWKCPFRLWASEVTGEDSFQIKTLTDNHTCSRKFSLGSLVTYSWIAKRYFKQIIQNPEISYREIKRDLMRKHECRVSIGQCSRAKKKALEEFEGCLKDHYARLSDYKAELLKTNPGSTVEMRVNKMDNGDIYFNSFYICFKGVKDGWINGCRKFICLDGCFLKNTGQLLSAIGRDANNHIYPLAWAVVSVENKDNWNWFLNLLKNDIQMEGGLGLTLMSDQHKGILEGIKDVFPYAEHRQCTRHIYLNFKKKFRGITFRNAFWAAANSTTKKQFEEKMEELKTISEGAYNHLIERDPTSWSRAFFEVGRACDAYENGMSESFNSRVLVARRKPIIAMLEEIRTFVMEINFSMATTAESLKRDVCPKIKSILEDISKTQRHWTVIPSNNVIFEVRKDKDAFVVNIAHQSCTCRSWQLAGIPCVHAVASLAFIEKDPENYVSHWFKKDMFKEAYKHSIKPLNGSMFWPKTDDIKPLPPLERRMPGRPSVKRKRDPSEKEKKNKKVGLGRKMTCKRCLGPGHNIRSCTNEKRYPQPKVAKPKGRRKKVVSTNVAGDTNV